jgi:hypothetical protein
LFEKCGQAVEDDFAQQEELAAPFYCAMLPRALPRDG